MGTACDFFPIFAPDHLPAGKSFSLFEILGSGTEREAEDDWETIWQGGWFSSSFKHKYVKKFEPFSATK